MLEARGARLGSYRKNECRSHMVVCARAAQACLAAGDAAIDLALGLAQQLDYVFGPRLPGGFPHPDQLAQTMRVA